MGLFNFIKKHPIITLALIIISFILLIAATAIGFIFIVFITIVVIIFFNRKKKVILNKTSLLKVYDEILIIYKKILFLVNENYSKEDELYITGKDVEQKFLDNVESLSYSEIESNIYAFKSRLLRYIEKLLKQPKLKSKENELNKKTQQINEIII